MDLGGVVFFVVKMKFLKLFGKEINVIKFISFNEIIIEIKHRSR